MHCASMGLLDIFTFLAKLYIYIRRSCQIRPMPSLCRPSTDGLMCSLKTELGESLKICTSLKNIGYSPYVVRREHNSMGGFSFLNERWLVKTSPTGPLHPSLNRCQSLSLDSNRFHRAAHIYYLSVTRTYYLSVTGFT